MHFTNLLCWRVSYFSEYTTSFFEIEGFRRGVVEAFALLGCYTRLSLFVTDVSGESISPIFKGQAVQEDLLNFEDGTDMLFQNFGNQLPTYQESEGRDFFFPVCLCNGDEMCLLRGRNSVPI